MPTNDMGLKRAVRDIMDEIEKYGDAKELSGCHLSAGNIELCDIEDTYASKRLKKIEKMLRNLLGVAK